MRYLRQWSSEAGHQIVENRTRLFATVVAVVELFHVLPKVLLRNVYMRPPN